jgi:hypothetical protein
MNLRMVINHMPDISSRKENLGLRGRNSALPPIVREGQNMHSRGRQPTEASKNIFAPAGVALGVEHGKSFRARELRVLETIAMAQKWLRMPATSIR